MAAELLVEQDHQAVLHARNAARAEEARRKLPEAEAIVVGDLEAIAGAKDVAAQVNALGRFDAVIHNAAVGYREAHRLTADGLPHLFAISTLSAYILTAVIEKPTSCGGSVVGTARRLTRRASCTMRCSPLPLPIAGQTSCRTPSSRVGCRPGWAAL